MKDTAYLSGVIAHAVVVLIIPSIPSTCSALKRSSQCTVCLLTQPCITLRPHASRAHACLGVCPGQDLIEHFRTVECGGRVLTALTGSAPTAPEVKDFLQDALLIPITEGYGSTGAPLRRVAPC